MAGGGDGDGRGGGVKGAEGEYATAKTSVWWDIENCQVPRLCDPHAITQNIRSALEQMDYKGPVNIFVYGDTNQIAPNVQQALNSTGLNLNHVPAGVKDASDKKILVDMLFWAIDNPPPANYLLISGDRDFSNALHGLSFRKYNILLAQPQCVSQALVAAAKSIWLWTELLAGGPPLPQPPEALKRSTSVPVKPASQPGDSSGNRKGNDSGRVDSKYKAPPLSQPPEALKKSTSGPMMTASLPGDSSGNQKGNGNGRADNRSKEKQVQKNPNQPPSNIPRSSSREFQPVPGSPEIHIGDFSLKLNPNIQQPMTSSAEATEGAREGPSLLQSSPHIPPIESNYSQRFDAQQFNDAPHQFFGMPRRPGGPNYGPPRSDRLINNGKSPMNNGKSFLNNQGTQFMRPLRPSDLLPPQPNSQNGDLPTLNSQNHSNYQPPSRPGGMPSTFISQQGGSSGPPFTPQPPANYNAPSGDLHHPPHFYHDNSPRTQPAPVIETPSLPSELLYLVGNFLRALSSLKNEMIPPTEAYIADCMRFEMNVQNFDIRMVLDCGLKYQYVVVHKLGNLTHFTGKNESLWKCVNIQDCNDKKHPRETWDAILKYLSSTDGRSAIQSSQCRYQAAIILRKACLKNLILGDILQILHVITNVKKWVLPHSSSWQPLTFLLPVASQSVNNTKT